VLGCAAGAPADAVAAGAALPGAVASPDEVVVDELAVALAGGAFGAAGEPTDGGAAAPEGVGAVARVADSPPGDGAAGVDALPGSTATGGGGVSSFSQPAQISDKPMQLTATATHPERRFMMRNGSARAFFGSNRADILAQMHRPQANHRAFTVTELLVVIGIIALLVTIVVLGAQKVVTLARVSKDLSQQRAITNAQSAYASDNNDAFASNRTEGLSGGSQWSQVSFTVNINGTQYPYLLNNGNTNQDRYHCWVRTYGANVYNVPGQGQTERDTAITSGVLYPYIGSVGSYRSPYDPTKRLRSYSLNSFVGSTVPEDAAFYIQNWASWIGCKGIAPGEFNTTKRSKIPVPSQTIMSIIEDDTRLAGASSGNYFNNNGWVIDPRAPAGTPNQGACIAGGWNGWIDWPAFWESKYITYSYVDGSTESYQMINPNVERAIVGPPFPGADHNYAQPPDSPGSPWRQDWMHFRERLLPGVIPPIINRSLIPQS
jgi:type II secretory pathway pseudopilin PulG